MVKSYRPILLFWFLVALPCQGAESSIDHWSLVPPQRPKLPTTNDKSWRTNAIDDFILARLEKEGLHPSPAADKATLIRRVTFDLTGLPPTWYEVDAFLRDDTVEAYERVVDRLLHSPHYGEHMARFWLDAARYGDTHGLHLDNYREIWPYRDWVMRAFNQNMSFDQFTIEQLAGDLLPDPTLDQRVATGFNRCHVSTNEGGSIAQEVFVRNVVDRVVTTGTVFMGLTMDCTRCHDHKYDPMTMEDFYSLFAFFNNIDGKPMDGNRRDHPPVLRVPSVDQQQQLDHYDEQISAVEKKLREPWPEIDAQQLAWEHEIVAVQSNGDGSQPSSVSSSAGIVVLGDWHTIGPFGAAKHYLYQFKHGPEGKPINLADEFKNVTGETIRWQTRPDWIDGRPHVGLPGEVAANFLFRTITAAKAQTVTISLGSDDGLKVYLNDEQLLVKEVERSVGPDQDEIELSLKEGKNSLLLKIVNTRGGSGFYFSLKSEQPAIPADIAQIVQLPGGERSQEQQVKVRQFYRDKITKSSELEAARSRLSRLREARAGVDRDVPTTLVWQEKETPRPAHYLTRGEYDKPAHEVSRRTPLVLPPMKSELPVNRLGLAKWLVDPAHPLTARVAVNRLWQQVMGTGIVKTAEDFGSQGELPSHPDLLDWLAATFREDRWDVKRMTRRIVMSSTYRQSSRLRPGLHERDPGNRLYARGPRYRLDAEMLRDQALFVSGLLVESLGGPSVKPPQPDGLWYAVGYTDSDTVRFVADKGPEKVHRRTLYTFIKRTAPPPQMSIVDAPSRESCVVRRERTNTPLIALMLLNDPQYVEAARALAERTMREGGEGVIARATTMFRLCTCRNPTAAELDEIVVGYRQELVQYQENRDDARKLVSVGELPPNKNHDVSQLAAWTMMANMLLCTDEVVTKN